jgi:hypothetical protein
MVEYLLDPAAMAREGVKAASAAGAFDAVAEHIAHLPIRHSSVQAIQVILSDLQLPQPSPTGTESQAKRTLSALLVALRSLPRAADPFAYYTGPTTTILCRPKGAN